MATYLATVDISDLAQPYYGLVYDPPVITRTLGSGDVITGFVEYSDCEWEMFPTATAGTPSFTQTFLYDQFRNHVVKVEFRDESTGSLVTEWVGRITEDWLVESGGVHLRGSGFPREAFEQRIPTPVITLDDFPAAVDVGKSPPYVIGIANKLKLLYINDGAGGFYDYLLMLGADSSALHGLYRDTLNQGATLPTGAQSFDGIPPTEYTKTGGLTTASGYSYVRIRFTSRQVNSLGALVAIYADLEGDNVSRSSPIEAIRAVLSHEEDGLFGPAAGVETTSFDAARDYFASLVTPRQVFIDGVIGRNNQPISMQDVLRPLLKACNGALGVNTAGQFTIAIDGPPTVIGMSLGAGPTVADNNLIRAGTRKHTPESQRPKRLVLDYCHDEPTGTMLFQRIKAMEPSGRDILDVNPFLRIHLSADLVADRLAKQYRNSQDIVEGTVAALPGLVLNQGDVFLYTWLPHGCEDEPRKVIRIRKELDRATIDHRKWDIDEWGYTPTALPANYDAPGNSTPPAAPGSGLVTDTGADYITTGEIFVSPTYQTIKTISITIAAAGHLLKKWAFVEVCTQAQETGGFDDTITVRLRNTTTGDSIEQALSLGANQALFFPYTVYLGSFSLAKDEPGVAAGGHTIVLEVKSVLAQKLFYGSSTALTPGFPSLGYVRAQEWS